MPDTVIQSTTQKFLEIYDVTNDILILKDGSTALIMTVNAMNFGLLAEPEQDAIIYSYAGLLNSINYPIQIVIRSQTKDVTSYLRLLEDEEQKAQDDIKRGWIKRYRAFVSELIKERNVLDKKFYVVIPASALEMGLLPPSTVLPGVKQPDLSTVERSVILEKAKEILEPKRDHLLGQLGRIGLIGRQLNTQEIIQLFYLTYNPEAAEGQQITDTSSYTTPLVQASVQGGTMDMTAPLPTTNPAAPVGGAPATTAPQATMPAPTPPVAPPTPAPTPISSPTPMATPMPAAAMPVATTPGVDGSALDAQNEINSTLQQLGGVTPAPASVAEISAPIPTTAPTMVQPPVAQTTVPAEPMATMGGPSSSPAMTPQTVPAAPVGGAPAASDDALPPLPEI